jgi:4-alpha-glucanotransferase
MEGYKDPFNRRTYPWGREDMEFMDHFKRLGKLRKDHEVLRLGDIRFFQAQDGQLGFTRSYRGKTLRVYINRSPDTWAIPAGKVVFAQNLRSVAPQWLELAPMGLCVTEDE